MWMDLVNDLFNSVLQYVITGVFAFTCAFVGVKLRQKHDNKEQNI